MGESRGPPFVADAVCFDLLIALLDSWSLWEEVTAELGSPDQGQPRRDAALRLVTGSGAYRRTGTWSRPPLVK